MRVIEHNNKKAYLSEKTVKSLAERFDWKRYTHEENSAFLAEECWFSNFCRIGCTDCPLAVFAIDSSCGCLELLKSVANLHHIKIQCDLILCYHNGIFEDEIREQLTKIRKAILNLPKVKNGGEDIDGTISKKLSNSGAPR